MRRPGTSRAVGLRSWIYGLLNLTGFPQLLLAYEGRSAEPDRKHVTRPIAPKTRLLGGRVKASETAKGSAAPRIRLLAGRIHASETAEPHVVSATFTRIRGSKRGTGSETRHSPIAPKTRLLAGRFLWGFLTMQKAPLRKGGARASEPVPQKSGRHRSCRPLFFSG